MKTLSLISILMLLGIISCKQKQNVDPPASQEKTNVNFLNFHVGVNKLYPFFKSTSPASNMPVSYLGETGYLSLSNGGTKNVVGFLLENKQTTLVSGDTSKFLNSTYYSVFAGGTSDSPAMWVQKDNLALSKLDTFITVTTSGISTQYSAGIRAIYIPQSAGFWDTIKPRKIFVGSYLISDKNGVNFYASDFVNVKPASYEIKVTDSTGNVLYANLSYQFLSKSFYTLVITATKNSAGKVLFKITPSKNVQY